MTVSMIVAVSANNVIGRGGELPWRLPEDLRRFKQITMGKPIVMGRATWDSIGRPLPGRRNIVMTRQQPFSAEGCEIASGVDHALQLAGEASEVMVIGGGHIYRQFLPLATRLYLTRVAATVDGDTFFPEIVDDEWCLSAREDFPQSAERQHAFEILTLDRR